MRQPEKEDFFAEGYGVRRIEGTRSIFQGECVSRAKQGFPDFSINAENGGSACPRGAARKGGPYRHRMAVP